MTDATTTPVQTASTETTAAATSASSQATGVQTTTTQQSGSAVSQGSATSGSDPWAGLTPENLTIVQNKKWADTNAALKAYGDLERAFSAKSATVDVPSDVSGYDFAAVSDLPEGMDYSADFETAFKGWALENKVPKGAAQGIRDKFVEFSKAAHAQQVEAINNAIAQSKVTLVREWGPEEGPTFSRNVELATRAVEQLGMSDHLVRTGAMIAGKDGKMTVVDAKAVMAFAKIGHAMFAEDSLYGAISSTTSNPFAKETENATAAGRIVKENPQMARQLIAQAGREKDFAYLLSRLGPG